MTIVFFAKCTRDTKQNNSNFDEIKIQNVFTGTWKSLERFYPYRSYLTINSDSTYYFEYGACIASGFSKGKWEIKDTIIVLNSFEMDSCMYLSHFGVDCEIVDENDTTEHVIEKTISGCEPFDFTDYIEFKNEEFFIDSDTLKFIAKKPKLCPEIRNDFLRLKRDTTANSRHLQ